MTTAMAATPPAAAAPTADEQPRDGDGAHRGVTTVAPRVFERLAVQAATEVPGVEGEVRTGAARLLPWVDGAAADAAAEVGDDGITLDLTFNVAYPEPVRRVADTVRDHVTDRIRSLTGRSVREINITVPALVTPARHRRTLR